MKKRVIKRNLLAFAGIVIIFSLSANKTGESGVPITKNPIYLNTSYSFEERAADLVSRLTPEEKEGLLGNNMAAVPRLGINAFNVWSEALHGVMGRFGSGSGSPTSFPNSVALGSSWDPSLMQRETNAISDEARALNSPVISGLTYYSPVVEPVRDPRWGRTGESYGEDPFHRWLVGL
jgi:beta-glucosidase-like glycosyl hydrolase